MRQINDGLFKANIPDTIFPPAWTRFDNCPSNVDNGLQAIISKRHPD